jgi:hypothetical protein
MGAQMPTRTQPHLQQMPLDLYPDESAIQLSPSQEKELDKALADLLLKRQQNHPEITGGIPGAEIRFADRAYRQGGKP